MKKDLKRWKMENLKELKTELDQIEMEYKEHWDSYPNREKWREKGQELSRTKRQLKLKIQEIENVT